MFIAAQVTILRYGIHEWIKKMWYVFTVKYYSAIKNKNLPFA